MILWTENILKLWNYWCLFNFWNIWLYTMKSDLSSYLIWSFDWCSRLKQVPCLEEHRELLQDCMRIVFTNSKSLVDIGLTGSAVYSVYSLMNHSCVPNTNLSIAKVGTVYSLMNHSCVSNINLSIAKVSITIENNQISKLLTWIRLSSIEYRCELDFLL